MYMYRHILYINMFVYKYFCERVHTYVSPHVLSFVYVINPLTPK